MRTFFKLHLVRVIVASLLLFQSLVRAAESNQLEKGQTLYVRNCLICHQLNGQGNPPSFPPLAKSDYLLADPDRGIRAICEGLSGSITVGGTAFNGLMPAQLLTDAEIADVLTYVLKSWGNNGPSLAEDHVRDVRAKTQYKTFDDLVKANSFAPLPKPPEGFAIRDVTHLTNHCVRLLMDRNSPNILALASDGDIWRVEPASGKSVRYLQANVYLEPKRGRPGTLGFCYDSENRLYITCNRQIDSMPYVTNEVTVYRTQPLKGDSMPEPTPWFRIDYPWGIGPFNHGVSCVGQGPDGFIYVSSGSRTDGNEAGKDSHFYSGGEVRETACMWKLDPKKEKPDLMIHANGLRNPYGFCWDKQGRMLATDNGPDANAAEELNVIEGGKHYGFPFQFSNWSKKPYDYTPDGPSGLQFQQPVGNLGPAAGGSAEGLYNFNPHSSPAGLVHIDDTFPEGWRGKYVITRFGNLLQTPEDVGFDLLRADITGNSKSGWKAKIDTALAPLARPLDVIIGGPGKLYLVEYSRPTDFKGAMGFPGRILELAVAKK